MKQKNLILMVVAVGCGLVAALLTSQIGAKTTKVETEEVIVAAKDMPVGTLITKETLPLITKIKVIPKDALPQQYVNAPELLIDKRLSRAIHADETFDPRDLNTGGVVLIPKGMDMMSVQVGLPEAVAGFVMPGSHVDILTTANSGDKKLAFPLLVDMLVLAVDSNVALPKNGEGTFQALNTVSLAVTREQALLLQLARSRGCPMSLVLRHPDKQKGDLEDWKPKDVIAMLQNPNAVLSDTFNPGKPPLEKTPEPPVVAPKVAEVITKLPIATEDIPANTELTADVIKKFSIKEITGPAPENAVLDLDSMHGKVLQNGVAKDQWLSKSFIGSMTTKAPPKHVFEAEVKEGPVAEKPKEEKKLPEIDPKHRIHDVFVVTGNGHKIFRYHEKAPGEWALVGEVVRNEKVDETKPQQNNTPPKVELVPVPKTD